MSDVTIKGRGKEKAILLLAAADKLNLEPAVVKAKLGGYSVPEEVAKEAGLLESDAPAKEAPTTEKKAPAKPKAKSKE